MRLVPPGRGAEFGSVCLEEIGGFKGTPKGNVKQHIKWGSPILRPDGEVTTPNKGRYRVRHSRAGVGLPNSCLGI